MGHRISDIMCEVILHKYREKYSLPCCIDGECIDESFESVFTL